MATSIDDNAADENLYKLFGEMSVIQYTRLIIAIHPNKNNPKIRILSSDCIIAFYLLNQIIWITFCRYRTDIR